MYTLSPHREDPPIQFPYPFSSPPRSLPDPPPGKEREVEDPLKRGPGSHGVLEWLIDAKNNLRHRPDPQLGRPRAGGRVLSATEVRLASSEAHKKEASSDLDEEERKRRKEWMARRRAHQLELRQQIRRRYEQLETEKSPPSQDGCRSDDSLSSQRGRRGDSHPQSSHYRSRAAIEQDHCKALHKASGTSDGLGGKPGRRGRGHDEDERGDAPPHNPTAMSLAHFLKKNAQQLRDVQLRKHRRSRRRYSQDSSSGQDDSDGNLSRQDQRGGKKESKKKTAVDSTSCEFRKSRHALSRRGDSQKDTEGHKTPSSYRGKQLFIDKGVGVGEGEQQEDHSFSDSHFDDSSGDEAFVCRLSAPSLDSNDLQEEEERKRKKKTSEEEESSESPWFPSKSNDQGVSSLGASTVREGGDHDEEKEKGRGGAAAIHASRRQAAMDDHHRRSRLRPPLREKHRGRGGREEEHEETSLGVQSEDASTSSKDERSISRWSEESEGDKNFGRVLVPPLNPSYVSSDRSSSQIGTHRSSIDLHRQEFSPPRSSTRRLHPHHAGDDDVARRVSRSSTSPSSSRLSSSSSPPLVPIRSGGDSEKEENPWYREASYNTRPSSCSSSFASSAARHRSDDHSKTQYPQHRPSSYLSRSIPVSASTLSHSANKSMKPFASPSTTLSSSPASGTRGGRRGSFEPGGTAGCLVDDLSPQSPLPRGSSRKKKEKKSLTGLALDPRHLNLTLASTSTSSGVYPPLDSPCDDGGDTGGGVSSSNAFQLVPSSSFSLSPSRQHAPNPPCLPTTTAKTTTTSRPPPEQPISRSTATPPYLSFPHRMSTTTSSSSSSSFFSPPYMSLPSPAHPSPLFYPSPSSSSPPSASSTRHPSLIPTRTSDFADPIGGAGTALGRGGGGGSSLGVKRHPLPLLLLSLA